MEKARSAALSPDSTVFDPGGRIGRSTERTSSCHVPQISYSTRLTSTSVSCCRIWPNRPRKMCTITSRPWLIVCCRDWIWSPARNSKSSSKCCAALVPRLRPWSSGSVPWKRVWRRLQRNNAGLGGGQRRRSSHLSYSRLSITREGYESCHRSYPCQGGGDRATGHCGNPSVQWSARAVHSGLAGSGGQGKQGPGAQRHSQFRLRVSRPSHHHQPGARRSAEGGWPLRSSHCLGRARGFWADSAGVPGKMGVPG